MLHTRSRRILMALLLALGLILLITVLGYVQGTVAGGLPPRPEPTATPGSDASVEGAIIRLQLLGILDTGPQGVWTAVQWQDAFGDWHTVEGWQGTTELDGSQAWWVGPEDFDTGPFRWVVYESEGGPELGHSDSFMLPTYNRQVVMVTVGP